jgi:hypothetical protein
VARHWYAAVTALAVVIVSAVAAAGAASAAPELSRAAVARPVRPGDPMARPGGRDLPGVRGVRNGEVRSANWSGYAVSGGDGAYRSVSASWTEPAVKCTSGDRYASFWLGLDGYSSHSVEQVGTDSDCAGKSARYGGWYEMYPAVPVYFRTKVKPGDHLSASVTFSGTDTYTLVLRDRTRGWLHTITKDEAGLDRSSAEVITEAPSSGSGVLRLADFGAVGFTDASANGTLLSKQDPAKIVMIDGSGLDKDATSAIRSAGAFHNTWIRSN